MNRREIRIQELKKALDREPTLLVEELAKRFHVSEMTIRRDLKYIEAAEKTADTLTNVNQLMAYAYPEEEQRCASEKQRIAEKAVSLLESGDTIILDSGTTAAAIADRLPDNIPLTVICYSHYIFTRLCTRENLKLILIGGAYHPGTQTFSSEEGINYLRQIRARKFFVCASGVHDTLGLTCINQHMAAIKKAALRVSQTKILVTDSEKAGILHASWFASLDDMDIMITDSKIDSRWKTLAADHGVQLYIV